MPPCRRKEMKMSLLKPAYIVDSHFSPSRLYADMRPSLERMSMTLRDMAGEWSISRILIAKKVRIGALMIRN